MGLIAVDGFGEVLDEGDKAARHNAQDVEIALARQREQARPGPQLTEPKTGAVLCWECEKPIPPDRLERHPRSTFCVPCLEQIELRQKLRRERP